MLLIVDADSLVWVGAYYADQIGLEESLKNLKASIEETIKVTEATETIGYLGAEGVIPFRRQISKIYKSTRPEKPEFYKKYSYQVRKFLIDNYNFQVLETIEADDAVANAAAQARRQEIPFVVCGTDKDLLQIEGLHYNPNKKSTQYIYPLDAVRNLCMQILTGDPTDNIKGLPGIGPVKAAKILQIGEEKDLNIEDFLRRTPLLALGAYIDKLGVNRGLEEFSKNTLLVLLGQNHDTNQATGGYAPEDLHRVSEPSPDS